MASKADILEALRADIAALEAAPPSEEPCAQIAAWPCPAEDDAVCGRDREASCAQDLGRSSHGEEQESAPHSKQVLYVDLTEAPEKYDILRRSEKE